MLSGYSSYASVRFYLSRLSPLTSFYLVLFGFLAITGSSIFWQYFSVRFDGLAQGRNVIDLILYYLKICLSYRVSDERIIDCFLFHNVNFITYVSSALVI